MRLLSVEDVEALQGLFESCPDYTQIVAGREPAPNTAEEALHSFPPGKSPDDKSMFGIVDSKGGVVGALDCVRGYPDETNWWIGLLLLLPEIRAKGLGQKVVSRLVEYVQANGGQTLMLGVVEDNRRAFGFWQKLGFELFYTTEPRQFGNKTQAVHVMRRELSRV